VEKLYRDITSGNLRRKRGADYDLSDSDDGGEARRRMKRRQEAKLRKALLEDERLGKIAENPKKMAFLRAIEDRGEDDEMDFLDDLEDPDETMSSQSQPQADISQKEVHQVDNSQPDVAMGPPKRKLPHDPEIEKRLPPHLRRTKPAKRPSNLSEIRESLSNLIEEPNAILMSHESSGSDSEPENDDSGIDAKQQHKEKENRDPFASRRKKDIAVVDRISLKRASSSNTVSTTTRLAFTAPSSTPGFKVPALLRRTTTNSSISSSSSTSGVSGTERAAGGFGDEAKFAKKAGKNSGVNYFARENERKMKVEEVEKRRKEKRWKGAEGRRKVVGGLFEMGKFE
jgi:mediator of replication checkpoint protein 1